MSSNPESKKALAAEMLTRTQALGAALRGREGASDAARSLPVESIQEMKDADLFRVLQPARWGGLELEPRSFFDIEMELAKHSPSTAWVYGVVAVHAWQLALFPEQAQQDVWGEDSSTLISSSYMPVGKVTHVEGGYMLSGRWGFSSGSDHCDWAFLGAFVPPKEAGQRPDMRTFLVPKGDYRLDDTWFTSGLQGTGSKDVVIDEPVFVPEHRTHRFSDGFKLDSPGNAINPSPLYRVPFGQLFVRSVSTSSIGMLEGAIESFVATQKERVARGDGRKVTDDPALQRALADAQATARELRLVLYANFDDLADLVARGEEISVEKRVAYRYDSARVVPRCRDAVLELFAAAGGGAIFQQHGLQRYTQALLAARQHHANGPEKPGMNYGRVTLGMRTNDFFL